MCVLRTRISCSWSSGMSCSFAPWCLGMTSCCNPPKKTKRRHVRPALLSRAWVRRACGARVCVQHVRSSEAGCPGTRASFRSQRASTTGCRLFFNPHHCLASCGPFKTTVRRGLNDQGDYACLPLMILQKIHAADIFSCCLKKKKEVV